MATDLLTLANELSSQERNIQDYHYQKYKLLEFKILIAKILSNQNSNQEFQLDQIQEMLSKILTLSNLKSSSYLDLALSLKPLIEIDIEIFDKLEGDYLSLLAKSQSLNPNNFIVYDNLGEYFYNKLPHSQLKLLDKKHQSNLKKSIAYFKYSLELNPFGIKANYFMSQIQYLIANIDLAYKHSSRLNTLCELNLLCSQNLNADQLKSAEELNNKLNKIVSNTPQSKKTME
jgi:hypothetical protein